MSEKVRWYERGLSLKHVEERITKMSNGVDQIIAVEVYDHQKSGVATRGLGAGMFIGPWIVGPEAEVLAELEALGHQEFDIKARAGIGRP